MIRTIALFVMTLVVAAVPRTGAPALPSPAVFPLAAGTYWIYEGTTRVQRGDGDVVEERATRRMEIVRTIQHGALTIAVVDGYPGDHSDDVADSGPNEYLIVKTAYDDYFFVWNITPEQVIEASSDPVRLSDLLMDEQFFVLDLPLTPGKTYAPMDPEIERDDTFYAWHIDSRTRGSLARVRGVSHTRLVTKYEIALRTLPDHTIIEFVPGIGITRYTYSHHGSIEDVDMRLVQYHRAVSAPIS